MTALATNRASRIKEIGSIDLKVKGGVHIFKGAFVVLVLGYLAPMTAASGLKPVGKALDEVDNTSGSDGAVTCAVDFLEPKAFFPFIGDPSNLFAQANIGGPAYGLDDQTVTTLSSGKTPVGVCWRFESVNSVQTVWVEVENLADEGLEARVEALEAETGGLAVQAGTGALVAGVLSVSTGVTITSTSRITATRKTKAGTSGVVYDAPSADRTAGIPGTGAFKIRSYDSTNTAATSDTSTIDYVIVG